MDSYQFPVNSVGMDFDSVGVSIEVSEWQNGLGYNVRLTEAENGLTQHFSLTHESLDAVNAAIAQCRLTSPMTEEDYDDEEDELFEVECDDVFDECDSEDFDERDCSE